MVTKRRFLPYAKETEYIKVSNPLNAILALTANPLIASSNWYKRLYNTAAAKYNNHVANKGYEEAKKETENVIRKAESINNLRDAVNKTLINQYSWFDINSYIDQKKNDLRADTQYSQRLQRIREAANTRVDWWQVNRSDIYINIDDPFTFARKWEWKLWKEFSNLVWYNPVNSWWITLWWNTYATKDVNWTLIYQDKNWNIIPKSRLIKEIDDNLSWLVNRDNVNKIYDEDYNEHNTSIYWN